MTKNAIVLTLAFCFAVTAPDLARGMGRHGSSSSSTASSPNPVTSPSPASAPSAGASDASAPEPGTPVAPGPYFTIKGIIGATSAERAQLIAEAPLADRVIHSPCFRQFMLERDLIQTNGLSNQGVIDYLQGTSTPITIAMYSKWLSHVVGYRNPGESIIHKNRKFFAGAAPCDRASNDAHETSHIMGFDHDYKATLERPYSVPYSINAGFAVCCAYDKVVDIATPEARAKFRPAAGVAQRQTAPRERSRATRAVRAKPLSRVLGN